MEGLFFDFDGVTARSFEYHFHAWRQVLPVMGVEPDSLVVRLNEGSSAWKIAQALCRKAGVEIDEEEAKKLAAAKNEIFRAGQKPEVYAEVFTALAYARQQGIKTALVTGSSHENLAYVLGEEGLGKFDLVIREGDYEQGKPKPEPYLTAAERLAVPPQECVVVENAPLGIVSAKNAGMYCIALTTTLQAELLESADLILPNHHAFLDWLQQKNLDK